MVRQGIYCTTPHFSRIQDQTRDSLLVYSGADLDILHIDMLGMKMDTKIAIEGTNKRSGTYSNASHQCCSAKSDYAEHAQRGILLDRYRKTA